MGFDPASAAALSSIAGTAVGPQQLGAPAQPFVPGGLPSQLTDGSGGLLGLLSQMGASGVDPVASAISSIKPPVGGSVTPPEVNEGLLGEENPALKALGQANANPSGIGGFFGNLDETLGSPAKTLGLGILGQIDPRLGLAGIGLGGLLGKNKVFGG